MQSNDTKDSIYISKLPSQELALIFPQKLLLRWDKTNIFSLSWLACPRTIFSLGKKSLQKWYENELFGKVSSEFWEVSHT